MNISRHGAEATAGSAAYDPDVALRLRLPVVAAAAGACLTALPGCASPLAAENHPPNAEDAAFLRSMTQHEQGTLPIPRLAQHRALRAELRGIARTMTKERQANLRRLGALGPGAPRRTGARPASGRPPSSALADLSRVKDATSFDHEFMRTMIEQNQRAMAIANHEAAYGSDPEVKRLAIAISSARRKELDRLRAWLRLWYGDLQPSPPAPGPPRGGGGGRKPRPGPPSPGSGTPLPL
jgi:uncharacterized protein (DUF305 family)